MNRLLLQITYRCTSRCRHCIYCSNDKVGGALTAGDVERIIHQTRPRECVVFTGGEASLLPDVVISGIKVATSLGIESWLNSNGSWGKDPGFAKEYSEALVTHGLARANISVDALHQEFVPVDSVLNAIRALQAAGVKKIKALVTFVNRNQGLLFDQRTEELLTILNSEPGVITDIRPTVSFVGRSIVELQDHAPQLSLDAAMSSSCGEEDDTGAIHDLTDCSYYDVGAEGKVFICAGFAFPGSLLNMAFSDIINKENMLRHPLIAAFQESGVRGLLDAALAEGYRTKEYYTGKCHVCWDCRNFLRRRFPDILTPIHAYEPDLITSEKPNKSINMTENSCVLNR
jgi:hypothetical protein